MKKQQLRQVSKLSNNFRSGTEFLPALPEGLIVFYLLELHASTSGD